MFLNMSKLTLQWDKPLPISVLDMTLNCVWWWGSTPGALKNVEHFFMCIINRSTLVAIIRVPSMGQIELLNYLLYLKQFNCVQTKY